MVTKRFGFLGIACLLSVSGLLGDGSQARVAEAAKRQDEKAVRSLLAQKVNVNTPEVDGTTALHWAAYLGDAAMTELLLKSGANVKAANRYGVTPLSLACKNGNEAVVSLLLNAGADPKTTLPGGETVLMTAARTGRLEPVKLLIAKGADVHARESGYNQTALQWAAAEGHAQVIETLIAAGADYKAKLASGFSPLMLAVREGKTDAVKVLLKAGADINEKLEPEWAAKLRVGYGGGAPRAGVTPLILAVTNGHLELAAHLLDAGADPNLATPGYTALHVISHIRKTGAGDNDPPPMGSGTMSSIDLVKKLAAKGASLNARMTSRVSFGMTRLNTVGATTFFLAAKTADAELMRTLAALGADPLIPNADNSTPLMAAAGLGTRSPGEDAGTESEVVEAIKVALELGNDINAVDDRGETAMHGAAYKNYPEAVEALVAHGAKIEVWNQKNKQGWTPLAIAAGYRFGNFKPSPPTVAALTKVMAAAGASTVIEGTPTGTGYEEVEAARSRKATGVNSKKRP
jgi:uncharacterized protein